MRRVELLLELIRSETGNGQFAVGAGVQQNNLIQFLQNAQDLIFSQANQQKPKFFLNQADYITIVRDQEKYQVPSRTFLSSVDTVEYSSTGKETEFYPLNKYSLKERSTTHSGYPSGYISRGLDILLVPPATSGSLRVNRVKELDRLDIRRGKISAHTASDGAVTALTLDASDSTFDSTQLNKFNYLCIVDRNGDIKMRNLEYDSVNASTGVVTITNGSFSFGSTEAIANGYYVTAGENTTNRSPLPDTCERFLIKSAVYETRQGDKSKWSQTAKEDMKEMAEDIIESFALAEEDTPTVPITDTEYMESDLLY
jgi:hypothetical protein